MFLALATTVNCEASKYFAVQQEISWSPAKNNQYLHNFLNRGFCKCEHDLGISKETIIFIFR